MRSIKELLQVMLDNQDCFIVGLCNWVSQLLYKKKITQEERMFLIKYIQNNRPSKWSSLDAFRHRNLGMYWCPRNIKPRIKWIEKHIKLNS